MIEQRFLDDRDGFERQLRGNLSLPHHTLQSLRECVVSYALELLECERELRELRKRYAEETAGMRFAPKVLQEKSEADVQEIAGVIEGHFENPALARVVRATSAATTFKAQSRAGKQSQRESIALQKDVLAVWQELKHLGMTVRAAAAEIDRRRLVPLKFDAIYRQILKYERKARM